ncbi:MAG: ATPase [Spirochaetales bacterium]|nr:ATPase [Spirochaetales bacterium]
MNKNPLEIIKSGRAVVGIELGSTRIKAVLIDDEKAPIASGGYGWENSLVDGIWTYSMDEVERGLREAYRDLKRDVKEKYGADLKAVKALGISAMMHGYLVFDKEDKLLVPFRTWRNNITGQASKELTELFHYPIPQRWSMAHLYQAMLNKEEHVPHIGILTTLSGYVHWKLTGRKVVGAGEASGMFSLDSSTLRFRSDLVSKFDKKAQEFNTGWKLLDILPEVLTAGEEAGTLTEEGALWLDPAGDLKAGAPLCPPEGDAGTGMVATNSINKRTGNVSAGTSTFAMIVLEKDLKDVHHEIDLVTTPDGSLVAMAHSNNCTSDFNAWVSLLAEGARLMGADFDTDTLYEKMMNEALKGAADCGGLLSIGYLSGEHITGFTEGRPLFVRQPDSPFSLADFLRAHLYSSICALKTGVDILTEREDVQVDEIRGHGGFFKTPVVGQRIMAAALNTPVSQLETAGEGGAWGIALLAAFMTEKKSDESLSEYLDKVFAGSMGTALKPDPEDVQGFNAYFERYHKGLAVERAAVETI